MENNNNLLDVLIEIKEMCKNKMPSNLSAWSCYESYDAFTGHIIEKIDNVLNVEENNKPSCHCINCDYIENLYKNKIEKIEIELNVYKSSIIANLEKNISNRYRELLGETERYKYFLKHIRMGILGYCKSCEEVERNKNCHHCNYFHILKEFKDFEKECIND